MKRFFIFCAVALSSFAAMMASTLGDIAAKLEAIQGIIVTDATAAAAAEQPEIKLCKAITPSEAEMLAVLEIVETIPAEFVLAEAGEGDMKLKIFSEPGEGKEGEMLVVIQSQVHTAVIYMQGDMEAMLKGVDL